MVTYNRSAAAHPSRSTWRCAPAALWWAMSAWDSLLDHDWIEEELLRRKLIVPKYGMVDKTGESLAEFVNAQFGGWGYEATHESDVSWGRVAQLAGGRPLILYGTAWQHWVGVRNYFPEREWLSLANPNPGYRNVHEFLPERAWPLLGPFNLLVIERSDP